MKKVIAMIPARMGSQRLTKKNLRLLDGVPLINRCIHKCIKADCFDEIWVNSEDKYFGKIASSEGVNFHQRPKELGDNNATSEDFILEFLEKHSCSHIIQVHSIAPLLTFMEVRAFTENYVNSNYDVMLSCINDQIEVAFNNSPVNFSYKNKTNSQDLVPTQRITWSITGWRKDNFIKGVSEISCGTYFGKVGFHEVSQQSGHVIKTQSDLDLAEAILKINKDYQL
tara:strand:+ start:361 stop:1038 length:678 start_codon:yes stop_codon:yes gene_type:complete